MIEFIDVSFSYGKKKILENFSLEINDGDRICLFAPSGFGKSTILRLIMGLEKPKSGEIRIKENIKISAVFEKASGRSLTKYLHSPPLGFSISFCSRCFLTISAVAVPGSIRVTFSPMIFAIIPFKAG